MEPRTRISLTGLLIFFISGASIFLNLGDWLFDLWVQRTLAIILSFFIVVPILMFSQNALWAGFNSSLTGIRIGRLSIKIGVCLKTAVILALTYPHTFS